MSDGFALFSSPPAIHDRETVAFTAVRSSGEALTGRKGRLTSIANRLGNFRSFEGVDVNEGSLLGSTVNLNFLSKGLSHNSVAFWAELAVERSGIFRADANRQSELPASLAPRYSEIERYTTTIAPDGDSADIYFPALPDSACHTTEFSIALMLQGALVDKADYSNFASQVASYGFIVVVPNNERTISAPNGQSFTGLFAEQRQVNDVLAEMKAEDVDASSPLFRIVDTSKMGLLGHSFGGAVGLGATQAEICQPGLCSPDYTIPSELKAGIFYGTSFRDQQTNESLPINNEDIAIGLVLGSLDGVALPSNTQRTYDQTLNSPKALITVEGANHYSITNADNLLREPNRPTLDQATATGTIAQWSGLFLRANLLNDRAAFDAIFNTNPFLDPNVSIISQP
ncbi:chlorophyllase [Microcoleus sp. FACHB-1515]|nr:chlorophyllase [Microcoleus sp. FACHB-1515]